MYILELAVQAVRGFAQSGRISLKPGYLVLRPQAPGPVPLCGLVSALCFSDGRGGDAAYLAPGQKSGKAGLSLVGNDQLTYRLVRDLGGAGALHRLNKASGQYEVITQDATEAAQFLRSQVGVPPKTTFEQIFCFTPSQLPTQRPKPKAAAAGPAKPALQKSSLASAQPVAAAADVGQAQARLAELERELGLTKEVDQLQFRHDGLSSQMFELESKLKGGDGLKAAVAEAEAAFAKAPTPESMHVSKDIVSRAERYPELLQRRDEALAKLEAEREQAESQVQAPRHVEPVWKDMRFVAGMCAGAGFLLLGAFLEGYPRYVALLEIPSFGFAALLALKYVEDLQGGSRVSRKGDFLASREKKIREEFEAEAQSVRQALATAGVETAQELIDLLARKPLLAEKVAELKDQLAGFEQDPEFASASARYQQLKAEQEAINKALLEKGGYLRDLREVEREIERTREAIAKALNPGPAAAAAEPTFSAVPTGPTEVFEDPTPQVLLLAADLFTCDVPTAGGMLKDRAAQYLAALCDRRYHAVEFDRNGKGFAHAPGRTVPAGELPGKDLDLFYFSVRLTLIEKYCARFKVPVLLEDLPTLVDPVKLQLLARMLKHVGTMTQVLHVSSDPSLPAMADLAVTI
ncbi:MAG: AAA family ATPase [Myxococcaceae bacterium]